MNEELLNVNYALQQKNISLTSLLNQKINYIKHLEQLINSQQSKNILPINTNFPSKLGQTVTYSNQTESSSYHLLELLENENNRKRSIDPSYRNHHFQPPEKIQKTSENENDKQEPDSCYPGIQPQPSRMDEQAVKEIRDKLEELLQNHSES